MNCKLLFRLPKVSGGWSEPAGEQEQLMMELLSFYSA